jgi:fructokinase
VEIVEEYYSDEPNVKQFMEHFFNNYGRSMANLINILDPDIVVLGGGVSNFDEIYNKGTEAVEKYIFSDSFYTPIVKNRLGDSAGVIGAALMGK